MKILAIIQARMSSSRLPGKVLYEVNGKTMLEILVNRVKKSKEITQIVVATSKEDDDMKIYEECKSLRVECFRGSLNNLIERFYETATYFKADIVVRITADCPLIDPEIIDFAISTKIKLHDKFKLITNRLPLTFPDGMDVDVMKFEDLQLALNESTNSIEKEHIIPFFVNKGYSIYNFESKEHYFQDLRLTLDYIEDFELISNFIKNFGYELNLNDIIQIWKEKAHLFESNKKYIPENYYENYSLFGFEHKRIITHKLN